MSTAADPLESVEAFRQRARTFLKENLPPAPERDIGPFQLDDDQLLEAVRLDRAVQQTLFDGGFAGIVVPREYGGQGLTPAHHTAFCEELVGYDYPYLLQVPTFSPMLAVILDFGTHEQKLQHVPPILRGETTWVQYLSEPSSGSDAAGAQTRAVRDGEDWLLNGSKIWSSSAWRADWALCLVRTNPDVPKHRGLTVFIVPAKAPGIEMRRIKMLDGSPHFCQEFMTDVRIPDSYRIGEVDDGWTVTSRWLYHERSVHFSPLVTRRGTGNAFVDPVPEDSVIRLAMATGTIDDPFVRDLIGEARTDELVLRHISTRIAKGIRSGRLNAHGAAVSRLLTGVMLSRRATIEAEVAGVGSVAWLMGDEELGRIGVEYLMRQRWQIAGGTSEMARNVISERVLGMPRERDDSRSVPFREVRTGPSQS